MPAAKQIPWTPDLLRQPTATIQRTLARRKPPVTVSREAIRRARLKHGIPTPQGHGGPRPGAGRGKAKG